MIQSIAPPPFSRPLAIGRAHRVVSNIDLTTSHTYLSQSLCSRDRRRLLLAIVLQLPRQAPVLRDQIEQFRIRQVNALRKYSVRPICTAT